MDIKFENGSRIEIVKSETNIRGVRSKYIEHEVLDQSLFNIKDLENATYNWRDLNDKTLKIIVSENTEGIIVAGHDQTDDKLYIIKHELNSL